MSLIYGLGNVDHGAWYVVNIFLFVCQDKVDELENEMKVRDIPKIQTEIEFKSSKSLDK